MVNSCTRGILANRHRFEAEPIDLNRSGSGMSSLILWEVSVEGYQDSLLKVANQPVSRRNCCQEFSDWLFKEL